MKNQEINTSAIGSSSLHHPYKKICGCLSVLLILTACSPAIPSGREAVQDKETAQETEPETTADATTTSEPETMAESETTTTELEAKRSIEKEEAHRFTIRHNTITAASCDYAAVQAAVHSAGTGVTVKIPAGDCNWHTQQLNVPAGVYLQGAGQDVTIIRRTGDVPNTRYLVAYNCANGEQAIFSDMTLVGNGDGAIQDKGLGLLNGCKDFKVHDSKFTDFIFSGVYVGDAPHQRGVIYKNNFINNFSASLMNLGYGVVVYGGGAWPELELGSPNAVFIEDNYFSGNRHNVASNNGSVYVFRHNTVVGQDPAKDFAMTDAHGLSSSPRGSRSFEIYDNVYSTNISSGLQRTAIGIRGGDGVIFNNTIDGTISRGVELMPEGFRCGTYPGQDQIRSVYIWNNRPHGNAARIKNAVDNECPKSIKLNRDYFLKAKPGYRPYTYPHPLRNDAHGKRDFG
jgi:hypothetical protein